MESKHCSMAYQQNIEALLSYFESGCTRASGALGIELEHIIVKSTNEAATHTKDTTAAAQCNKNAKATAAHTRSANLAPVSYAEEKGIKWVLEQLAPDYPQKTFDEARNLLGLAREGEAITLEPAAQLELSAGPFESLSAAEETFASFENKLESVLSQAGEQTKLLGYHPISKARELTLIPKKRYEFMDTYLSYIGEAGAQMMRGSASAQISIDYNSEADCLRKMRLAYAISPLFALICDNSPIFEGALRTHKLVRTKLWQKCDPDRCGLVPNVMSKSFTWQDYASYILNTPAILVENEQGETVYTKATFAEIYAQKSMNRAQLEHALSMFFTDVRLKTYLEIRPADAMPVAYVLSYAALVKGLFYTPKNLDKMDALFEGITNEQVEEAKNALMEKAFDARVYKRAAAELVDELFELAQHGLCEREQHYLDALRTLATKRKTLADIAELELKQR